MPDFGGKPPCGSVQQPPVDAYEHHGLSLGHYWVWYEGDWITGNWDGEDWNLANGVTTSSRHVLRGPRISDPPAGGPPTGDPASQPDSNTENPGRLVPIWIREYVEWKIEQSLGDKPPLTSRADSEIPERGEWFELSNGIGFRLNLVISWLPRRKATYGQNEYWEPLVRLSNGCTHDMTELDLERLRIRLGQPAGGDLAAQPDSTPKDPSGHFTESYKVPYFPPIGVHDYDSLVACLRSNFKLAFGENALFFRDTDPQDMIQRMAAEIQNLKRLKGGSVQGLESEVRVPTAEDGPE
jgi:hypothetical protein